MVVEYMEQGIGLLLSIELALGTLKIFTQKYIANLGLYQVQSSAWTSFLYQAFSTS